MEFRFLGDSGLKVSAISYGNWVTHAEGKAEQAIACVQAALEVGITTFDTADTYGKGRAETILGDALVGERREGLEILTKVFGATGPGGPNDSGLSRKHILESINVSLTRLQTDYVDVYQAHRYDFSTPLEETMEAFADVVRAGKALYIGVSEWTPQQLRAGHALARELKISFVSNQSKYNALYRVIEPEVVPTCQQLGIGQICFSPIEQGILTGKYMPGQPVPQDSRATDAHGAEFIKGLLTDEMLTRVQRLSPLAEAEGPDGRGLGPAERQCRIRDHRRLPTRAGQSQRRCGRQVAVERDPRAYRRGPGRRRRARRLAGRVHVA
jgi:aryl-alcohol dehydrogenase-like predicted oxidoreductase